MALPISLAMLVPQITLLRTMFSFAGLGERESGQCRYHRSLLFDFAVIGNGTKQRPASTVAAERDKTCTNKSGNSFYHGVVALAFAAIGIFDNLFCR